MSVKKSDENSPETPPSIQDPSTSVAQVRTRAMTKQQRLDLMREIAARPIKELELTPQHQALLRQTAYLTVLEEMGSAAQVMSGEKSWTNNQVRLFGMLLSKVMPDLKYSKSEVEHNYNRPKTQLTREELEGLVIDAACDTKVSANVNVNELQQEKETK